MRMFFPKSDENLKVSIIDSEFSDYSIAVVNELIDKCLDDREREIFELRFFDNYRFMEIAKIIGSNKDTVHRTYKKSLDKIKEELMKK